MKSTLILAFGLAAALFAQLACAQIIFYEHEGLRGRSFSTDRAVDNFDHTGFNDKASSAIVEHGMWEVCSDAHFKGKCATLRRGQYPSLASLGMNRVISSVRPVSKVVHAAPPPPPAPEYTYYPHYGEPLYQAQVVATRAVVGPPEQRCWVEQQQVVKENQPNIAGAVIGGVLGGVLGHQIGGGTGRAVATGVGAVGGAALGANVNRGTSVQTQDVQRCEAVPNSAKTEYWDVTYVFNGVEHRAQLAAPPGAFITVNAAGDPRM
jgi:uncharacterized protein YcfJ